MKPFKRNWLWISLLTVTLAGCDGIFDEFLELDEGDVDTSKITDGSIDILDDSDDDTDMMSSETYPTGGEALACFNLRLQQDGIYQVTRQSFSGVDTPTESQETMLVETGTALGDHSDLVRRTRVNADSGQFIIEYNRVEQDALLGVAMQSRASTGVLVTDNRYEPFLSYTLFGLNQGESHTAVYTQTTLAGNETSFDKTDTFLGEETITIGGKSIETCRFQAVSEGTIQDLWVAKSFGEIVKLVTNPGSAEAQTEQITSVSQGGIQIF